MAEEGHGRSDAHHGLEQEGEDGKKGHRLGVKMKHVDLIVFQHCVEEGGERGDLASPKSIDEDWDFCGCPANTSAGRWPSLRFSPLIKTGGEHGAHLAHGLIIEHQRLANCGLDCGGALVEDRGFFPLSACFGAMAMK